MSNLNALTKEEQSTLFKLTSSVLRVMLTCQSSDDVQQAIEHSKSCFIAYRDTLDIMINKDVAKLVEATIIGMLSTLYQLELTANVEPNIHKDLALVRLESWFRECMSDVSTIIQTDEELRFFGKSQFMFVDLNKEQMKQAQLLMNQHKAYVELLFKNILNAPTALGITV